MLSWTWGKGAKPVTDRFGKTSRKKLSLGVCLGEAWYHPAALREAAGWPGDHEAASAAAKPWPVGIMGFQPRE